MPDTPKPDAPLQPRRARKPDFRQDGEVPESVKEKLDEFIEATFPASDPFCLSNPVDRIGPPE